MPRKIVFPPPIDADKFHRLKNELNIRDVFIQLLLQRGIETFSEARDFFRPHRDMLHDPFLMKDMRQAVERIRKAIRNNEKILVYGDYDVDGTTSVASIYSFFRETLAYKNIEFYIPDRYTEGYGLSSAGVQYAHEKGFSLVITLDCGIKSVDKIRDGAALGIDFIVCDHHLPGDELPAAVAILNPKQNNCPYPYKELSGCGVALKLMQALCIDLSISQEEALQYLDLAAISACADIVPLTGENRVITALGIQKMQEKYRPGIAALLDKAKFRNNAICVEDIVFIIAPRINAAGRLEHAKKAVELLIADEEEAAGFNAEVLHNNNQDRKELDKLITDEALASIAKDPEFDLRKSTVVYEPHWHKGVVGIVASRLIEKHYRPTVVLTESNGKACGSARSVKGFDLYAAMETCLDLYDSFGGHMHAAGVTMPIENVPEFKQRFDAAVSAQITEESLSPVIEVDSVLSLPEVDDAFYKILKQFAPFGPGNMNPVFLDEHVHIHNQSVRTVGENHAHLQLQIKSPLRTDKLFKGVAFKQGNLFTEIYNRESLGIAYSVNENVFRPSDDKEFRSLDLDIKEFFY